MTEGAGEHPHADVDIHLVVVWERGLDHADRILADLQSRFVVLEAVRVTWTPARFARNLTRLYGQNLPPRSEKEVECGTGAFLVVIVLDQEPRRRRVRTSHGRMLVNKSMLDAKTRYRRWTGGGHRIHATLNEREAGKDVFMLLGRRLESIEQATRWNGEVGELREDLTGADGWVDAGQLLSAIDVTVTSALLPARAGSLRVLVDDRWWATRIVNDGGPDDDRRRHEPVVAGARSPLDIDERGDGTLDARWQAAILRGPERDERGIRVPSAKDRLYLALHDIARRQPSNLADVELLSLARTHGIGNVDCRDPDTAAELVDAYVEALPSARPRRLRSFSRARA